MDTKELLAAIEGLPDEARSKLGLKPKKKPFLNGKILNTEQEQLNRGTHKINQRSETLATCTVRLGGTTFQVNKSDIKEDEKGKFYLTATNERAEFVSDDPKAKLSEEDREKFSTTPGSTPEKPKDDHSPDGPAVAITADAADLVRDKALDVSLLTGTGKNGKIVKADVEKYLSENG